MCSLQRRGLPLDVTTAAALPLDPDDSVRATRFAKERNPIMARVTRRQILRGATAAALTGMTGPPFVHAQKGRSTLRFVAEADLKIVDPVWTTAYITRNHGYLVYDTLFGTDENLTIKPQMVDRTVVSDDGMRYTFTLRDGLKWHDGTAVHSEDCVESLKRWGKRDRFGRLLMAHTSKLMPIDRKTFTVELAERFGPVLEALGKPSSNVPFMMPARIAATAPDAQITDLTGSGPFRFSKDEWKPGEHVVYVRNPDYVPRTEAPSGSTGAKKVYVDKVIWRYMPDAWAAADALAAGDIDWWQEPPLDYFPKIESNPELQSFLFDPLGAQGWLRPNHLHPPFNNKKAREALLHMMDQVTYLALANGQSRYYRPCHSVFACRGPNATKVGADAIANHDLTKARQLVKESGYDGRPIVVIHVTDRMHMNAAGLVTRQRLESIGFNVILKAMDWSTSLTLRTRKEPPEKGGWNILHTWWMAADVMSPPVHFGLSGAGADAWFGWPEIPQLDKLTVDWVRTTEPAKRKQIAEELQKVALREVAYVPWGEWVQPTAYRKSVQGVLRFHAPLFWNVRLS